MPLFDIGDTAYHQVAATANATFSPLVDRAALVTWIAINNPSAADDWKVSVQGREVAHFYHDKASDQRLLSDNASTMQRNVDIFDFCRSVLGKPLTFPVPNGQTISVASVGGATADVEIGYQEMNQSEMSMGLVNHPQGNRFYGPIYLKRNALVAAAGDVPFDVEYAPSWWPTFFGLQNTPSQWRLTILAMFLQAGSRNAYAAATDHISRTLYMTVIKNGQKLYTRDVSGGIPMNGLAAAAGSANIVTNHYSGPFPTFQGFDPATANLPTRPFDIGDGASYDFLLNVTGDVGAGADYTALRQVFLVDVHVPATS